ncbi:Tn7 transposase TnsA N-terminal domain-containing protein [Cellvibrio sp. QJXJ]|uniref:Tn7 transposase TnsA N-terminal domain-containing protein n=1 Tax=Cellvibrio sp. QJXJ TaxID=2964606 RepID=UPI0021C37125|nr:Tn7 transposase TnsA N-terminal domain-containing protein [Cellvibrio sp. QJXJ]UUA74456.1 Tn7 transposase TnsA N-terminal domain-containing protein [Cellvibrio sp. QJXJ]
MNIPARKLKMSAVKNIVRFPAIKANGGKTILVESVLESKYCLHLEFDSTVETYFPQPKTFAIPGESEQNRYTPDFEVHYTCGQRKYVEVKPFNRASSEHYQLLFSRFELSLEKTLTKFLLVNEAEILRQPLLSNYEKLYQYRKRPTIDMRNLHQFAEIHHISMPLSRLISELGNQISLREIYTWLALGYLRFDIHSEHLSMMTEVKFDVC